MKWPLIPLVLFVAACDPTPPPQPETERKPNPAFETPIQALEQARAVEQQIEGAVEAQRKQLDAATQP